MTFTDTVCAPATVPGTGAICVLRVSGPDALAVADRLVRCHRGRVADMAGYSIAFGTVADEDGTLLDEVLVSVFRAPRSYTGEDSVEISCHSSSYIVSRLLQLLYKAGARAAAPGEFTRRAFLNGKMDLAQAEAVADVVASQNAAAHRVAFSQLKGGISKELSQIRRELLDIVSLMELELDFSEEDVEFADRSHLRVLSEEALAHFDRLIGTFSAGNAIRNGIPVAIVGTTNAGKSTLLNALVGEERAIVSDIHGTTRDSIEECVTLGGLLFRFIDTAGLRKTSEIVEQIGIERTFSMLEKASVVLAVLDLGAEPLQQAEGLQELLQRLDKERQKLIVVLNKADLRGGDNCAPCHDPEGFVLRVLEDCGFGMGECIVRISAKTGEGLEKLRERLADSQKDLVADTGDVLVSNARHIQALSDARDALQRVRRGLDTTLPTDLLSQDIREAIHHLGLITGDITTDEVLGSIFGRFCVGK